MKLTKLTPHIIQGFYNDLLANGRIVPKRDKQGKIIKKDGVAVTETAPLNAKTVRNVHGVLTKALSQAVKVGYIARNPCDMVDLPRVEKVLSRRSGCRQRLWRYSESNPLYRPA